MAVAEMTGKKLGNGVGKRYRAMHIQPGVVGYPENPDIGSILVTPDALAKMRNTFIGKPVVNVAHSDLEPEDLLNFSKDQLDEVAVGIVSDVGYDAETGWEYCDMVIWDDETIRNIDERGYSVSNAYDVLEEGPGGMENQIPYDHELLDGEYLHMAIVPNPRYKRARIFANSLSKPGGKTMGIKLFSKQDKKPAVKNAEPEDQGMEVGDAVFIDKETGEEIPAEELLNAYRNAQNECQKQTLNAEDEVEVDGNKVKVADMYNAWKNARNAQNADGEEDDGEPDMENAEDPTDTDFEEPVDESLQNGVKNSTGKKKAKVNPKLKNAVAGSEGEFKMHVNTRSTRLAAGQKRYGSKVKQGGNA